MQEKKTSTEIIRDFWRMEEGLDLFSLKICGVYFWKLIRADVIINTRCYLTESGDQAKIKPKYTFKERQKKYLKINSVPGKSSGNVDYYVLGRGKKQSYGDVRRDIFSYDVIKKLEECNKEFQFIDFPFMGDYEGKQDKNIESLFLFTNKTLEKQEIVLLPNEEEIIKRIECVYEKIFDVKMNEIINLKNKIINEVFRFKREYEYYKHLFIKTKPKKIYTTIYYRRQSAIAAARDLNIESIDIQYANINSNHVGFGFKEGLKIPYFPDKVIFWGKFFEEVTQLPSNTEVIIKAPSYFEFEKDRCKKVKKKSNRVTFSSQMMTGNAMFKIAYNLAKDYNQYEIIFRVHPGEMQMYSDYENYNEAMKLDNFRISTIETDNLHELLASTEYHVAVYSTTIVEGILHNTKTIFLDMEGVEEFAPFYEKGLSPLVRDADELAKQIQEFVFKQVDYKYFFNFDTTDEIYL